MSSGHAIATEYVLPWAQVLKKHLGPACERITIAGSIRRECTSVRDIEVVAVPRLETDMFGTPERTGAALTAALEAWVAQGILAVDMDVRRNGDRHKRFISTALELPVEIYIAQPDNAGNILAIRTGCVEFSKALVTSRRAGGMMPECFQQKGGYLWDTRNAEPVRIPCPTERAFFEAIGAVWVRPSQRTKGLAA